MSAFHEYAQRISQILESALASRQAVVVDQTIDQRSALRGFIGGIIRLEDDRELHFREFVDTSNSEPRLMYAYHCQDANGTLIFRYDNAAHKPRLPVPDHKHTPQGIDILESAPTLQLVIDEILSPAST